MIWRVILFWLLGVVSTFANFPRHSSADRGNTLSSGANTFIIFAANVYGTNTTNVLSVNLPATVLFQYDANGNLTNDGTRSFYYDAENQLTNVTVAGQYQEVFAYDGLRRRRTKSINAWQGTNWVTTNEIRYIYDGNVVIQERDTNNNVLVTYTRGLDLSGTLEGAGGIGGLLARTDTNGTTYYHCDGSGNVTALIDGNQNIVARYEYDAYGRLLGQWGSLAATNVYRFSSKEYDTLTGLYYYGHRYYDPTLQRFLNRDPIGEPGGINLYGFVGNNPANFVDPFGNAWYNPWSWGVWDSIGYAVYGNGSEASSPYKTYTAPLDPEDNIGNNTSAGSIVPGLGSAVNYNLGQAGIQVAENSVENGAMLIPGGPVEEEIAAKETEGLLAKLWNKCKPERHHIATDKNLISKAAGGPYTSKFQELFEKAGMTLQDDSNIIDVLGHEGPHPAYNAIVYDQLTAAVQGLEGDAYRDAIQSELRSIAQETQTPGTLLNKLATGGK